MAEPIVKAPEQNRLRQTRRRVLIECLFALAIILSIRAATRVAAGNLTPPGSVSSTMQPPNTLYQALTATSGFSSVSLATSSTGSAIQLTKCIIQKLNGNSCP